MRVARQEGNLSERHACGRIGMHRGSWRYRRSQPHDAELRARLRELAEERVRFGYRRLWAMLRRERNADGTRRWVVNHKRVHRIYREEGLAMRRKQTKRLRAMARTPLELPTRANQVWTMDFTKDRLASGRNFRTLNLMDGCTREALWIEVDTSLPGGRVVRVLEWLKQTRVDRRWTEIGQHAVFVLVRPVRRSILLLRGENISKPKAPNKVLQLAAKMLGDAAARVDHKLIKRSTKLAHRLLISLKKALPETDPQLIGDFVAEVSDLWDYGQKLDKTLTELCNLQLPKHREQMRQALVAIEVQQFDYALDCIQGLQKTLPKIKRALDRRSGDLERRGKMKMNQQSVKHKFVEE